MKPLRHYQSVCADLVMEEWQSVTSTLIVLPTGTGKTRVAAEIIKRKLPQRSLFIAHRKELIHQARQAIDEIIPSQCCEIEMADIYARHFSGAEGTVVAMVQSLNSKQGTSRRMDRFKPEDFGVLVIDEFHHSVAESYRSVINYFRRNPTLKVLGLTATPDRMDEEALGQVCDSVAFDYEILDAINDGWLVSIDQLMVPIKGLDFSHVKTQAGDLNQADLSAIMENESTIQGVVQPTLETMCGMEIHTLDSHPVEEWGDFLKPHLIFPHRTLIFTVSVHQAEMLANVFNRVADGIAQWVCGATADQVRMDLLERYNKGEIPIMVNCNCLSEGFDSPGVSLVVQARPTKSRALYAQQVGRATRPLPGIVDGLEDAAARVLAIANSAKPRCIVMDFVGNSGRHKLMSSVDILAGNVSDDALERTRKLMEKLGKKVNVAEALRDAEEDIRAEQERKRREEEARKKKIVARSKFTVRYVNPFDALDLIPVKTRGWDSGKTLSPKQKRLLAHQGVNPETLTYAQGRQIVAEIFSRWKNNMCSIRQANVLRRYHLPTEVTRNQAKQWLDILSKNQWNMPADLRVKQIQPEPLPF